MPNTDFKKLQKKGKKDINLLFLFPMNLGSKSYKELKSKDQNNNFRGSYTFKKENDEAHL